MSQVEIKKSFDEINEKIKKGKAVVVTAEEMIDIVADQGVKSAFNKVDVVTTGTFGIMCSSGAFINIGHTTPKIKTFKTWFNDVEAYSGIAAVDCYLGATQVRQFDPLNKVHPGKFRYGGGHVIEDLLSGKKVKLKAEAYGTDCYPRMEYETEITLKDLRDAFLYNPRNSYQNYNCGINLSKKTIYTYMGILRPNAGNATYSSAGQLSPLLNDPFYWTIGCGTKIFLGGAEGAVTWQGTQHSPEAKRCKNGIVSESAGTMSVTGNLKEMSPEFVRGASITGYGCSIMVGIGVPIPILNEDLAYFTGLSDKDIYCQVADYGRDYPNRIDRSHGEVSYADLKTGKIDIMGKSIPAAPLSSYSKALQIAKILKNWIAKDKFTIGVPQISFPTVPFQREDE